MPRPIEMNAHDPRRYLGDMLAWVHQALASERELLISLFGQDDASSPAAGHADGHSDVPSSSALLDKVLEGVCRPLKVKLDMLVWEPPLLHISLGASAHEKVNMPLQWNVSSVACALLPDLQKQLPHLASLSGQVLPFQCLSRVCSGPAVVVYVVKASVVKLRSNFTCNLCSPDSHRAGADSQLATGAMLQSQSAIGILRPHS